MNPIAIFFLVFMMSVEGLVLLSTPPYFPGLNGPAMFALALIFGLVSAFTELFWQPDFWQKHRPRKPTTEQPQ